LAAIEQLGWSAHLDTYQKMSAPGSTSEREQLLESYEYAGTNSKKLEILAQLITRWYYTDTSIREFVRNELSGFLTLRDSPSSPDELRYSIEIVVETNDIYFEKSLLSLLHELESGSHSRYQSVLPHVDWPTCAANVYEYASQAVIDLERNSSRAIDAELLPDEETN
jgi:hypothetical protein